MSGDGYDRKTDVVARTAWEAIRAWRAGNGRCDMLPWIDAPNEEKAGLLMSVSKILATLLSGQDIELVPDMSVEDVLALNIIYALVGEE